MLDGQVTMQYLNSKAAALISAVLTTPATIWAMIEGERVVAFFAIAGGVFAFLWSIRKSKIEEELESARKVIDENIKLREEVSRLAEQNERYRIRIAGEEESGNFRKPNT